MPFPPPQLDGVCDFGHRVAGSSPAGCRSSHGDDLQTISTYLPGPETKFFASAGRGWQPNRIGYGNGGRLPRCQVSLRLSRYRPKNNPCCPYNKDEAGNATDQVPERSDFLCQYENTYAGDPEQVHHAEGKQETHKGPAAAETIAAVLQSHSKGTP